MVEIHRVIAYVAVAAVVGGFIWSAALAVSHRSPASAFESLQALAVSLLVLGSVSGLTLLATGRRPAEWLHLVYAVVAISHIPIARSFARGRAGRRSALLFVAAFGVLGAVLFRLFGTG